MFTFAVSRKWRHVHDDGEVLCARLNDGDGARTLHVLPPLIV